MGVDKSTFSLAMVRAPLFERAPPLRQPQGTSELDKKHRRLAERQFARCCSVRRCPANLPGRQVERDQSIVEEMQEHPNPVFPGEAAIEYGLTPCKCAGLNQHPVAAPESVPGSVLSEISLADPKTDRPDQQVRDRGGLRTAAHQPA